MLFYTGIFKVQPPGAGRQRPESVYMGGLSQISAQIRQAAAVGSALNDRGLTSHQDIMDSQGSADDNK